MATLANTQSKKKSMQKLQCPLCAQPLLIRDRQQQCENGHNFDIAKEGYTNLLPVQRKRSKAPGDNKQMLQARRDFLNKGYYQCLATEIVHLAKQGLEKGELSLLDLGCGEGYYLSYLINSLPASECHALDISKDAAKMTAKRKTGACCIVASAYESPYFEHSFNFIYCVFSPYSLPELVRISDSGGVIVIVGPGANHLQELAGYVYDEVKCHDGNRVQLQGDIEGIVSNDLRKVKKTITIENQDIDSLLAMTPYYWSINQEKKQNLIALPKLTVTLDFEIRILKVA